MISKNIQIKEWILSENKVVQNINYIIFGLMKKNHLIFFHFQITFNSMVIQHQCGQIIFVGKLIQAL